MTNNNMSNSLNNNNTSTSTSTSTSNDIIAMPPRPRAVGAPVHGARLRRALLGEAQSRADFSPCNTQSRSR